jgi:hypothetical protein
MSLLSNVSATVIQGQQVVGKQVSAENLGVSGILNVTGDVVLSSANLINASGIVSVITTSYTVLDGVQSIITSNANPITITLPDPASNKGRILIIKNLGAGVVNSASNNVVPLAGGGAANSILQAGNVTPTKGLFVSDGTSSWVQMLS